MTRRTKPIFLVPEPSARDLAAPAKRRLTFSAEAERLTHARAPDEEGQVIAVARSRGGIGATMLAVNLAHQLAAQGVKKGQAPRRVGLIDLDLQFGMVAGFLDLDPSPALYDMARSGAVPDETFLDQSIQHSKDGLEVLCAPAAFAPLGALGADQVTELITLMQARCDYVVVDLPHALIDWVSPVLARASLMYLVTDLAVPSLQQARRLIDAYHEENLALEIEVVVNHQSRPLMRSRVQQEAAKALDRDLSHWLPDDPRAAKEAADRGVPLARIGRRSALSKAIAGLAKGRLAQSAARTN
ncbi:MULTISPECIES: AAA family ATPase [unclassified Thioclava]|uniref:AAA family ATPase n=1 Tax=unclassified Thioclava TaxID=2621713 RepID=UPI0009985CD0|nr:MULTISPECIES: AAA family ATPase [unclassified Thioclava]OOY17748.1 hypothetical protein BMI85_01995 [Thioclava sp. DLFJ4-1]OOY21397.1 hypothetical protein BMI86_02150 [Thioclava sp. DLFJ5-1]